MAGKSNNNNDSMQSLLSKSLSINVLLAIIVVILAIVLIYQSIFGPLHTQQVVATSTIPQITQTGGTTPNTSTSSQTLAGIGTPLNSTQLAQINDEPLSNYENAGALLLNGNLSDLVQLSHTSNAVEFSPFIINGKPSVIYMGAITCIYCGENRWAMALALAKFGNFSALYNGYSALGDGDVPTLYWTNDNYNATSSVGYGNAYSSPYINFISADYESPITQGFSLPSTLGGFYVQHAPNSTYSSAMSFMNSTGLFQGTPFTFWGNTIVGGADAVVFGNTTPSSATDLPIAHMTHAQILNQFSAFNSRFAEGEYAGADVYIAYVCPSINNAAPVCQLPAIKELESVLGA